MVINLVEIISNDNVKILLERYLPHIKINKNDYQNRRALYSGLFLVIAKFFCLNNADYFDHTSTLPKRNFYIVTFERKYFF